MPLLPRFNRTTERIHDQQTIARVILESTPTETTTPTVQRATLPGDTRRLRGIPAIGYGVDGAIPGTNPHNSR
jgi:hypothetical protein